MSNNNIFHVIIPQSKVSEILEQVMIDNLEKNYKSTLYLMLTFSSLDYPTIKLIKIRTLETLPEIRQTEPSSNICCLCMLQ
jgi:hypothetical protein